MAQTYMYDAFGKATPGMSFANEFTFAGQQTDPSGLQYLRARYMDPSTGRFMGRDSFSGFLEQGQGLNRYAYATNNVTNLTDPAGIFGCGICGDVGNAITSGVGDVGSGIADAYNGLTNLDPATSTYIAGEVSRAQYVSGAAAAGCLFGPLVCAASTGFALGYDIGTAWNVYDALQQSQ